MSVLRLAQAFRGSKTVLKKYNLIVLLFIELLFIEFSALKIC
jgi:hypothetical protein